MYAMTISHQNGNIFFKLFPLFEYINSYGPPGGIRRSYKSFLFEYQTKSEYIGKEDQEWKGYMYKVVKDI